MFPLKIDITAEVIAAARERQASPSYTICSECLIAGAMTETAGRPIQVGMTYWGWSGQGGLIFGTLPAVACHARQAFDNYHEVEPFSFEVAPSLIWVFLTDELIAQAQANRTKPDFNAVSECLAAVALKSILPNEQITCGCRSMWINGIRYDVTQSNADIIQAYMQGEAIQPFTLKLTAVPQS